MLIYLCHFSFILKVKSRCFLLLKDPYKYTGATLAYNQLKVEIKSDLYYQKVPIHHSNIQLKGSIILGSNIWLKGSYIWLKGIWVMTRPTKPPLVSISLKLQ